MNRKPPTPIWVIDYPGKRRNHAGWFPEPRRGGRVHVRARETYLRSRRHSAPLATLSKGRRRKFVRDYGHGPYPTILEIDYVHRVPKSPGANAVRSSRAYPHRGLGLTLHPRHRMTMRLAGQAAFVGLKFPTATAAELLHLDRSIVHAIARDAVKRLHNYAAPVGGSHIAIDEVKLGKLWTLVTDLDADGRPIVTMVKGKSTQAVARALSWIPNGHRIKWVVIDKCEAFASAVQALSVYGSGVNIVADKRHSHKRFVDAALAAARKEKARDLKRRYAEAKKQGRPIRKPGPARLTTREIAAISRHAGDDTDNQAFFRDGWFKNSPNVRIAYEIKETFANIQQLHSVDRARKEWQELKERIDGDETPAAVRQAFAGAVKYVEGLGEWFFNYFRCRITTASAEHNNDLAGTINREGRGYSDEYFVARCLVRSGGLTEKAVIDLVNGRKPKHKRRALRFEDRPHSLVARALDRRGSQKPRPKKPKTDGKQLLLGLDAGPGTTGTANKK